ncbi:hypothetical protein IE53DRAFT_404513, partial [Violaceomyces palustris]
MRIPRSSGGLRLSTSSSNVAAFPIATTPTSSSSNPARQLPRWSRRGTIVTSSSRSATALSSFSLPRRHASTSASQHKSSEAAPPLEARTSQVRVTDSRLNQSAANPTLSNSNLTSSEQGQAGDQSTDKPPSQQSSTDAPTESIQFQTSSVGASTEDLLKQRFYHAQSQNRVVSLSATTASMGDTSMIPPGDSVQGNSSLGSGGFQGNSRTASSGPMIQDGQNYTSVSSEAQGTSESSNSASIDNDSISDIDEMPYEEDPLELHPTSESLRTLDVPFDTHLFVQRLEAGGWVAKRPASVSDGSEKSHQSSTCSDVGEAQEEMQLQLGRRHDPAEALMEAVRWLITRRGRQTAMMCLNKGDVENQAYLFSAALSELRTEVQVRARNDAAALRSITTLLQREIDALEQKMKEDIERLKHDIQVDMNNRKAESKEEQNNLEQEIQDLNNRFTISLSDLKTEIEQNVKWDATRRSLFLVFGIAAIVAANLALADYLTRDEDAAQAKANAHKEVVNAGPPPASADAGAPASLGWATEGRVLSTWPLFALSATGGRRRMRMPPFPVHLMSLRQCGVIIYSGGLRNLDSMKTNRIDQDLRRSGLHGRRRSLTSGLSAGLRTGISPTCLSRHLSSSRSIEKAQVADQPVPSSIKNDPPALHVAGTDITIKLFPSSISIESFTLGLSPFHFDHVWLRDACQGEGSVHASNKQKLFHTSDIPLQSNLIDLSKPPEIVVEHVGTKSEPVLKLTFSAEQPVYNAFTATFGKVSPTADPHVSRFPISFLLQHALPDLYSDTHMDVMALPRPWAAKDLSHFDSKPWSKETRQDAVEASIALAEGAMSRPARIPWFAIGHKETNSKGVVAGVEHTVVEEARNEALYALTEATLRDGFAFVTGLPTEKTATEAGENAASLRELAEMMGEIRNTFYGQLWDVRSLASSRNIAYTNLDLGLHMDLLYFQNPPRFQFLHMLRNRVTGGASIFVDSFKVAERMWEEDRELWEILTKVPVGFHYVNDGRHYRFTHPTFELAHESQGHAGPPLPSSTMPRLSAVNYSPPFQSPLPLHPSPFLKAQEDRQKFYAALKRFSGLTLDEEFRYEKQMEEGECVIFDNRRVLHSRTGFEWNESEAGEVNRWLKGCYLDGDAVWSTYRALRTQLGSRSSSGGQNFGVPSTNRVKPSNASICGSGSRSLSTSTRNGRATPTLESAPFASTSNDPSFVDPRSRQVEQTTTPVVSHSNYRPAPPLNSTTIPKLYKQLSKSKLTFLVVLTGMAGYALCPSALTVATASPVGTLLALTAGMTLCSAAANALNQLVESPYDAQMPRTRARPLPSRSITPLHAFTYAATSAVTGVGLLGLAVNPLTAALGAANIVLYSFIYTPMKRMSIANTWVGALVGGLPPLMGWAACTGTLNQITDLGAWSLAALLFAWQFPHFNSLAHTLRAEYARGGYRMMAVTNPSLNKRVSLRYAILMIPICVLALPLSGAVQPMAYAVLSTPLNLAMVHAAWKFWKFGTLKAARWCFWVSLIHLPAVMLLAMG